MEKPTPVECRMLRGYAIGKHAPIMCRGLRLDRNFLMLMKIKREILQAQTAAFERAIIKGDQDETK